LRGDEDNLGQRPVDNDVVLFLGGGLVRHEGGAGGR